MEKKLDKVLDVLEAMACIGGIYAFGSLVGTTVKAIIKSVRSK